MGRLTLRCLLLSSLLLMAFTASAADYLLSLEGRQQYTMAIEARGILLTGVCIIKTDNEGSRGAIVNEFGIHALDFTITPDRRKVKLLNVMPTMNRWYVKRVVRHDLQVLFTATVDGSRKGSRIVMMENDGTVVLTNGRHRMKYSLKKMKDETTE